MYKPLSHSEWKALNDLVLDSPWDESVPFICQATGMSLCNSILYSLDIARFHPKSQLMTTCPIPTKNIHPSNRAVKLEEVRILELMSPM